MLPPTSACPVKFPHGVQRHSTPPPSRFSLRPNFVWTCPRPITRTASESLIVDCQVLAASGRRRPVILLVVGLAFDAVPIFAARGFEPSACSPVSATVVASALVVLRPIARCARRAGSRFRAPPAHWDSVARAPPRVSAHRCHPRPGPVARSDRTEPDQGVDVAWILENDAVVDRLRKIRMAHAIVDTCDPQACQLIVWV